MLSPYKHISFDLDGTLVHTVPEYRYEIVPRVVKELGGKIDDKRHIDKFWFESGRDEVIKNHFGLEPAAFWALFRKTDSADKRSPHTRAYDDAERTFRKLKSVGKIVSIITGAPHYLAQMEISKLNDAPYDFYLSVTDSEFIEKPNPESLLFVIEKLKFEPKETVYIGNSNEDAYFAKNAGVDFIYLERREHEFDLKDYSLATIHSLDEMF